MTTTSSQKPRFTLQQRVIVDAAHSSEYPRRARDGAVGVIGNIGRLVNGARRYDVYFYQDVTASNNVAVRIPEQHLQSAPEKREELTPVQPETPARAALDPDKAAEVVASALVTDPRFALGQKVMLDHRSDLAYDRVARKGAVGVIVGVGKPVRGIRRYDVQYAGTPEASRAAQKHPLRLLPVIIIREEHLLPVIAEMPDGAGVGLRDIKPVYSGVAHVNIQRGGTTTVAPCAHEGHWQAWDARYRRCTQCGAVERVAESEAAR